METIPIESIHQLREAVYQTIEPGRDAAFEDIDASRDARSAVEVSLSPTMERTFSSVYGAVRRLRIETGELRKLLGSQAEASGTLDYDGWVLYALDHTPYPRRAAKTVSDLGLVHGADGVEVGHQYSLLGRVMHAKGSWVGVVDVERIATCQTPTKVGATQIDQLKLNARLKRIVAMDSEYVTGEILDTADEVTRRLIRFWITFHIVPSETGHLYLLCQIENNPDFYLLFPTAEASQGKSDVHKNAEITTSPIEFDKQPGTENLWLVWSDPPIPALEEAFSKWGNPKAEYVVNDFTFTRQISELLQAGATTAPKFEKDTTAEQTILRGEGNQLMVRLKLIHRKNGYYQFKMLNSEF